MDRAVSDALNQFADVEANLRKLETLWAKMEELIGDGMEFAESDALAYEEHSQDFQRIIPHMPAVSDQRVEMLHYSTLTDIAVARVQARDLDDFDSLRETEESAFAQGRNLRAYRSNLVAQRREVVRPRVDALIIEIDERIERLCAVNADVDYGDSVECPQWELLRENVDDLLLLLGGERPRSQKWSDMTRHLGFAKRCDLDDISKKEWPVLRELIKTQLYAGVEPIPVVIKDLAELAVLINPSEDPGGSGRDAADESAPLASHLEILDSLGAGAYGDVWQARDNELAREVAVKIVRKSAGEHSNALAHARSLARIEHPNVVRVYSIERVEHPQDSEPVDAIVMELVRGETLLDRTRGAALSREDALRIVSGILDGVSAIHDAGIAHTDLHLGNVMFSPDTVKLIDILYRDTSQLASTTLRGEARLRDLRAAQDIISDVLAHSLFPADASGRFRQESRRVREPTMESMRAAVGVATAD